MRMLVESQETKHGELTGTEATVTRTISDLSEQRTTRGSGESSLLRSSNLNAVIGAKLSDSSVDRFLIGRVATRSSDTSIQL